MDEMKKIPEDQNNEEIIEQEIPATKSAPVSEPVVEIPTPKAPIPKLPFIIGGAVAGVAAIAISVALILGGGKGNQGGGTAPEDNEHEHSYGEWAVVDEPTCTEAGSEARTCECGDKETRPIAATAHTYDNVGDADCNICGATRVVDCTHTETEVILGKAATCTETGLTDGEKCKKCGTTLDAQQTIPMVAHTYDNKYDEDCNVCGHKRDAECAHAETTVIPGKAATCTATGITDGSKCKKCGEIIVAQTTIPRVAHAETSVPAVEATCTATGLTAGTKCSVCNKTLVAQQETPKVAHTYDNKYDDDCNVCGHKRDAECAHTETEVIPGKAATCTATGLTDGAKCKKCGEILTEQTTISMKPHTEVIDSAVEATCTATGLTEGKHCSVCSKVIVAQNVVNMKPHTEVTDAAVAATCTKTGLTEGKHCSVCNKTLVAQNTIAALGHIEVRDYAESPTCTETGLTEGKHCSRCYETLLAQNIVSALGHNEVVLEAAEATCTTDGFTEGKYCSRCYETLVAQTIVSALGHIEVTDSAIAPTCTTTGLTEGKHCSRCNKVLVAQTVIDARHTEGEWITDAEPTCTENGSKHQVCSVCTATIKTETILTKGHSYAEEYVQGDCKNPAKMLLSCTKCNYTATQTISPISATIYRSGYSSINGYIYSATFTVRANGGYGELQYKYELLSSTTNSNVLLTGEYSTESYFGFKSEYSLNNRVLRVTIKDDYGNSTKYEILVGDESLIVDGEILNEIKHDYDNDVCKVCGEKYYSKGLSYKYLSGQDAYEVSGIGSCTDKKVYIPDTHENKPVVSIGERAFINSSIEEVVLPDGVKEIKTRAFYECFNLRSVIVSQNSKLEAIGDYAFTECVSLTSFTAPASLKTLSETAFFHCYKLLVVYNFSTLNIWAGRNDNSYLGYYAREVITNGIPSKRLGQEGDFVYYTTDSTTYLVSYAGDSSVIELPDTLNGKEYWLYDYAFAQLDISHIVFSRGVLGFSGNLWYAFDDSKDSLVAISVSPDNPKYKSDMNCLIEKASNKLILGCDYSIIPNYVTSIGDYAFYGCSNLQTIKIPSSVMSIGKSAFCFCESLETITIPEGVKTIGDRTFSNCESLTTIILPESLTSIDYNAFYYCSVLQTIFIPRNVSYINCYAFDQCNSLINVVVDEANEHYQSIDGNLYTKDGKELVYYSHGKNDTNFIVPYGVTKIGDKAFSGCESIVTISLPETITDIGKYAFSNCWSLTSICIPKSTTSVNHWAFYGCRNLTIHTEVSSQPSGWDVDWNPSDCPVVWGYSEN